MCFRCDEKYTLGHKCKNRMLNFMLVDEELERENKDEEKAAEQSEGAGDEEVMD